MLLYYRNSKEHLAMNKHPSWPLKRRMPRDGEFGCNNCTASLVMMNTEFLNTAIRITLGLFASKA